MTDDAPTPEPTEHHKEWAAQFLAGLDHYRTRFTDETGPDPDTDRDRLGHTYVQWMETLHDLRAAQRDWDRERQLADNLADSLKRVLRDGKVNAALVDAAEQDLAGWRLARRTLTIVPAETEGVRMAEHTVHQCCNVKVEVETNVPQGGDSGHGGRTIVRLIDDGGTDMSGFGGEGRVEIRAGGDDEADVLAQAFRWAADELDRQIDENARQRPVAPPTEAEREKFAAELECHFAD